MLSQVFRVKASEEAEAQHEELIIGYGMFTRFPALRTVAFAQTLCAWRVSFPDHKIRIILRKASVLLYEKQV